MKRLSADDPVDMAHPALVYHREVLTNVKWSAIRRDFLDMLQTSQHLRFVEPKKLWRHSQEALGKWVLSQVARDTRDDVDPSTCFLFFPVRANLSTSTYDEQLIRDISLKCEASGSSDVVTEIKRLLERFNLSRRCEDAAAEVLRGLEATSVSMYYSPSLQFIDATEQQSRTAMQRRMQGPIVEFEVKWPKNVPSYMRRGCPSVSIPLAAYKKLDMCYRHFADKVESKRYPRLDYNTRFTLRAAALVLRYEGCLATGSLQLCADTRLKQHLHAAGYHVMDLCASPINAYMGAPRFSSHKAIGNVNNSDDNNESSSFECETVPNHFCSAFPDTDCYFGSLGSALKFDVEAAYNSREVNPEQKPLLLTLDVPYDEDICEKLFLKLVVDMQRAERKLVGNEERSPLPFVADYILVLPLWWDVPMQRKKLLFTASNLTSTSSSSIEDVASLNDIVKERSAMLQEGYTVPYVWPQRLAEAAGERWVCFDGVFVGDSYRYFCTTTNKWLHGVTATEVIGLTQPRAPEEERPALETLLARFYGQD